MLEIEKKRIAWIDIAKLIGIFCIYLGHFGDIASTSFYFVFTFHVPLFFFISGCMSCYDNNNLFLFLKKRTKQILIPFFIFSLLAVLLNFIISTPDFHQLKTWFITILKGCIRNQFFSGSLWFLSCLYILELTFKILKYLKYKSIILIVSLILFLISYFVISPRPIVQPHFIYNIDSMMYYIIYYAIGFLSYPLLLKLFVFDTIHKKILGFCFFIFSFVYSVFLFEGSPFDDFMFYSEISIMIVDILRPLIIPYGILFISKLLEKNIHLSQIGKETLYLCGNEYVIKTLIPLLLSLFGLQITITNPLSCYVYCIIVIILNIKFVIPFEKKCLNYIKDVCIDYIKYKKDNPMSISKIL